jgi:hypothetical protein
MKGSQESLTTVVVKSWPTPAARDHKDTGENVDMKKVAAKSKLAGFVAVHGPAVPASSSTDGSRQGLWQTATVSTGAHRQKDGSMIDKLDQQVKQWPTPEASQGGRQGGSFSQNSWKKEDGTPKQPSLAQATIMDQQAQNWATPANHDGTTGTKVNSPFKSLVGDVEKITPLTQGKLNPRWVETLMGLPVGWTMPSCASPVIIERTNSDCSGMESCRQQRNEPSEC